MNREWKRMILTHIYTFAYGVCSLFVCFFFFFSFHLMMVGFFNLFCARCGTACHQQRRRGIERGHETDQGWW